MTTTQELPAGTHPTLEARSLVKVFGQGPTAVRAVDGIDLQAAPGEVLLITGPSGSGKTTLLSLLGGLLRPTEGSVSIVGQNISALDERRLAEVRGRLVGFVFQRFNLLDSLSASENVEIALNLNGRKGKEARDRARTLLSELGMAERLDFAPALLSGGEQQRVSIARAIANDPPVILADEPTANLDSQQGNAVVSLLRGIAKREGRTVVIVSHDERIEPFADRTLWLADGRFVSVASR